MLNSGKNRFFVVACDLEIWRITLKNKRGPLLCYLRLCASFHRHLSSHIKFCAYFHRHIWIQKGVVARKRLKLGFDLCDLDLWPLGLTFCMDITSTDGNIFWQFHDDRLSVTDGRTDRQADWNIDRAVYWQLHAWNKSIHLLEIFSRQISTFITAKLFKDLSGQMVVLIIIGYHLCIWSVCKCRCPCAVSLLY